MGNTPSKLSASRGAAILGLSPWGTAVDVWLDIMEDRKPGFCAANGYTRKEFDDEFVEFRWGNAFEVPIVELAQKKRGFKISNYGDNEKYWEHGKYDFLTCHPDGEYSNGDLHEGKKTYIRSFAQKWGEPGTDLVPRQYQVQTQHQLIVTGREKCILSVLVFPETPEKWEEIGNNLEILDKQNWANVLNEMGFFHQYIIEPDMELHKMMLERYLEFWNKNVLECTPPEPNSFIDIKSLIKSPKGTYVATKEIEDLSSEYKQIGKEMNGIKLRKDFLKTQMVEYCRKSGIEDGLQLDTNSFEKIILNNRAGKKLHSYGKVFR